MLNSLDIKENDEHALNLALCFPLRGLLLCLRVIIVHPALVISDISAQGYILEGNLTELFADVDTLLLLIQIKGRKKVSIST
jgi:hypothetical protein